MHCFDYLKFASMCAVLIRFDLFPELYEFCLDADINKSDGGSMGNLYSQLPQRYMVQTVTTTPG